MPRGAMAGEFEDCDRGCKRAMCAQKLNFWGSLIGTKQDSIWDFCGRGGGDRREGMPLSLALAAGRAVDGRRRGRNGGDLAGAAEGGCAVTSSRRKIK